MKFCVDCKHYSGKDKNCLKTAKLNLVDGTTDYYACSAERVDFGSIQTCGTEGKYWELNDEIVA